MIRRINRRAFVCSLVALAACLRPLSFPSAADAKSRRPVIVAAGERSSIAISMNMNDEPQIRARTNSRGT